MKIERHPAFTIAIVGGGMGGLMTAYYLQHAYSVPVEVTIVEASGRLGGKVLSRRFDGPDGRPTGPAYEAGAAELYDYADLGPDPLRELVDGLGLTTYPMDGRAVFLGDQLVATEADLGRTLGRAAAEAVAAYTRRAKAAISPADYYESDWRADNADPLARQTFQQSLATLADPAARRYVEAAVHSDLATEPRHTSAAYGLQNYLMNEPGYMRLYGIDGGLEQLPRAVAARLTAATVRLNTRVTAVAADDDRYTLTVADPAGAVTEVGPFDFCVFALPKDWLPHVRWSGPSLAKAVRDHHAHYDHPAHYLRVTVRFREPFWRAVVSGSYFMLDAFGGCCVYDESARCPDTVGGDGVLGWLLAGEAAGTMANLSDDAVVARVLAELPAPLRHGRALAIDAKVHRWVGAVNARPGGYPQHDPDVRHQPDPDGHPSFFLVGDYLFDSTLNGVVDSADYVAAWIAEELAEEPATSPAVPEVAVAAR